MLRKAETYDWKEIKELNRKLIAYEIKSFDNSLNIKWIDGTDKYFQKVTDNDNYLTLVYEENGKIIGYLIASCSELPAYRQKGLKVEIEHIFIEEEYQTRRIGSEMFKEAEKWAKDKGATVLSVATSALNFPAVSFYKKHGFSEYILTLEKNL